MMEADRRDKENRSGGIVPGKRFVAWKAFPLDFLRRPQVCSLDSRAPQNEMCPSFRKIITRNGWGLRQMNVKRKMRRQISPKISISQEKNTLLTCFLFPSRVISCCVWSQHPPNESACMRRFINTQTSKCEILVENTEILQPQILVFHLSNWLVKVLCQRWIFWHYPEASGLLLRQLQRGEHLLCCPSLSGSGDLGRGADILRYLGPVIANRAISVANVTFIVLVVLG